MIWDVEWSGVGFYSVKGEFGTKDFECRLENIFPMNRGTSAYTEFESDDSLTTYLMDNPEMLQLQRHLIHSHNSMNTFFSSTDMEEITDNSQYYNYYLSVIVNNKMDICAKIAFRGKCKTVGVETTTFKGTNGKDVSFEIPTQLEKDVVYIYNCEIVREEKRLVEDDFAKRTIEIIEASMVKQLAVEKAKKGSQTTLFPPTGLKEEKVNWRNEYSWEKYLETIEEKETKITDSKPRGADKVTEAFVACVLACDILNTSSIEDILNKIRKNIGVERTEETEANCELYAETIADNYENLYHQFYDDEEELCYFDTLTEVVEIINTYSTGNWCADVIYLELNELLEIESELLEQGKILI